MRQHRPDNRLERGEYLSRTREFAKRGRELPHSKLSEKAVTEIMSAVRQRDKLRQYINDNLSNEALAKRHGVALRTLEKVTGFNSWTHVTLRQKQKD